MTEETKTPESTPEEQPAKNPRVINKEAPQPIWKQVELQEAAQAKAFEEEEAKRKAEEKKRDDKGRFKGKEDDDEGGSDRTEVARTGDESEGEAGEDNAGGESAAGEDQHHPDTRPLRDRIKDLGAKRAEAETERDQERLRAEFWRKKASGEQFTEDEAKAAGQQYETVKPKPQEQPPAEAQPEQQREQYLDGFDVVKIIGEEPKPEDFLDDDGYPDERAFSKAVSEYFGKKAYHEEAHRAQVEAERAELARRQAEASEAWSKKKQAAQQEYEDYDAVVTPETMAPLADNLAMGDAIAESDLAAHLLYYLCKNPAEMHRIAAGSPIRQVKEVLKLESELLEDPPEAPPEEKPPEPKPEPRKASSAPPPPPKPGATERPTGNQRLTASQIRERLMKANVDRPRVGGLR